MGICCSGSGAGIHVHNGEKQVPATLIICGYAGSSLKLLEPLRKQYLESFPELRVVTTTVSGLSGPEADAVITEQVDAAVKAREPEGFNKELGKVIYVSASGASGSDTTACSSRRPA